MSRTPQELEAQLNSTTDQRARIDLLIELASSLGLSDPERARGLSEQAQALSTSGEFAQEPYLKGVAGSLSNLSSLNNDAGNYDLAFAQSLQALAILEGAADGGPDTDPLLIDVLGNISWTYRSYGDYGVAAEYAMRALKTARAIGAGPSEARMLNILGVIYAEANDLNASLDMGLSALRRYRELGLAKGESVALNNLALTYLELGDGAKALESSRESLRIARESGAQAVVKTALSTLGEVYLGIQAYAEAEKYLLEALALARAENAGPDELQSLLNLGKVYQRQQNEPEALSAFQDALAIARAANDRPGESECHQLLAEVYEKRGEFAAALQHFKQFYSLKETVINENALKRLAGLQVVHQVETAKREAEIHYLKTIELKREIEERKAAQAALEQLAAIDPLTGLLNRREFFILGEREVQRALQSKEPLVAILFDLDHFKQINDTHGHTAGDQALVHTAKTVRENLRQGEIIGRFGGDEFAILLPGSSLAHGQQIAERLRVRVASLSAAVPQGKLSLSVSLGISELNGTDCDNLETLLEHADQALYAAKRAGRNQLAVYAKPSTPPAQ